MQGVFADKRLTGKLIRVHKSVVFFGCCVSDDVLCDVIGELDGVMSRHSEVLL